MEPKTINTLTEFTSIIEETCSNQETILFRGQQRDWPLLPSIMREILTEDNLLDAEKKMLEEFQRYSIPYLNYTPESTIEWLTLAQHYGLPTRLLDWTENPLTGLWFVVNKPPINHDDGVLWIFRPNNDDYIKDTEKNILEFERFAVLSPKHITNRITAQSAWFTVHKYNKRSSEFERIERIENYMTKLTKLIIPWNRFAHFRYHLNTFGLNHASIYPGLEGICSHIKYWYCFMSDEK
ncbi:MAG TPA: FRG domain-containing protein [Bacteroidales bacterium]